MTDYSAPAIWGLMVVIGLGTFVLRLSFIHWFGRRDVPPGLQRALRFVPAAVLSALVLPAIVYSGTDPGLNVHNVRLLAGACAFAVAWTTRSVILTMVAGMGVLWVVGALM